MNPTFPSDAVPLFWPGEILPDQLGCMARVPIPRTVFPIAGKALNALHMTAEIKPAAPQNLPHTVRGREAVSVLPRVGACAQRNRGAPHHLGQLTTVHWSTGNGEVGGSTIPPGTSDLQLAYCCNRSQHLVAVTRLPRAHERRVAVVALWRLGRRDVPLGVHPLGQKAHLGHARGFVGLQLPEVGHIHFADQPPQAYDLLPRFQIEVPEDGRAVPQQTAQCGLTYVDGMTGEDQKIRVECVGEIADNARRDRAGVAGPANHIDQGALVPQGARGTNDGELGSPGAAGAQDSYTHPVL